MSAPSRKKVRFSGKNSSKRVRLVCRVSTSVSAKSVFTDADARRFGPETLRDVEAGVRVVLGRRTGRPARRRPDTTAGRTRQADAEVEVGQIGQQSGAAHLRQLEVARGLAQRSFSWSRWIRRWMLKCQVVDAPS